MLASVAGLSDLRRNPRQGQVNATQLPLNSAAILAITIKAAKWTYFLTVQSLSSKPKSKKVYLAAVSAVR